MLSHSLGPKCRDILVPDISVPVVMS